MNKLIKFFSIVVLSVGLLGGCASQVYHDYIMSGQVVTVDDKQAVVCVSDTDGLKEHQVFNVYRTVYDPTAISEGENSYSREFVGKIRLGKTKDKHFAEAIVLDGEITRYAIKNRAIAGSLGQPSCLQLCALENSLSLNLHIRFRDSLARQNIPTELIFRLQPIINLHIDVTT